MTRTENSKAIYVLFTDDKKSAEFSIPGCKLVSNKGFRDIEIEELKDYVLNEQDSIMSLAKTINPMRAFMGL